jgi:hypothetical protein
MLIMCDDGCYKNVGILIMNDCKCEVWKVWRSTLSDWTRATTNFLSSRSDYFPPQPRKMPTSIRNSYRDVVPEAQ